MKAYIQMIGVAALGIAAVACVYEWQSAGAAESPAKPGAKTTEAVRALQTEKLDILTVIRDHAISLQKSGTVTGVEVDQAQRDVLLARLDIAEKQAERVTICKELVEIAARQVEMASSLANQATVSQSEVLQSKVHLINAKIDLEREIGKAN